MEHVQFNFSLNSILKLKRFFKKERFFAFLTNIYIRITECAQFYEALTIINLITLRIYSH